jgi:hypothetical protein
LGLLAAPTRAQQRPLAPVPRQGELPTVRAEATAPDKYFDWLPLKPQPNRDSPDGWLLGTCTEVPQPIWASSSLASQGKNYYGPENLTDDDPTTAWVEGRPDHGIGESFTVSFPFGYPTWQVLNGYQKNRTVWEDNSRVKKFKVVVNGQPAFYILLEDKMGPQEIKVYQLLAPFQAQNDGQTMVKFIIEEVYPGRKYKDTAISAFYLTGC